VIKFHWRKWSAGQGHEMIDFEYQVNHTTPKYATKINFRELSQELSE